MTLSLLIVDDHPAFRGFARTMLESDAFSVAGEAGSGEDALVEAGRLRPDVVLLDVNLPGIDGFEVARRLSLDAGAPRIVLTSTRDADDLAGPLSTSPAAGFIAKDELSSGRLAQVLAGR